MDLAASPPAPSFLQHFSLTAWGICQETVQELQWCDTNGRLVGQIVHKIHGRQEFFPIESVVVEKRGQVLFDLFLEIFYLGVTLRMSQHCLGVFYSPKAHNRSESLLTNSFPPSVCICSCAENRYNQWWRMFVATVAASLLGMWTTMAIFVNALVIHNTCGLPLLLLGGQNRSVSILTLGAFGIGRVPAWCRFS